MKFLKMYGDACLCGVVFTIMSKSTISPKFTEKSRIYFYVFIFMFLFLCPHKLYNKETNAIFILCRLNFRTMRTKDRQIERERENGRRARQDENVDGESEG